MGVDPGPLRTTAEPSDLDSPARYWDFWRPEHAAEWTDDGLTFVESVGPYGIFQVTGPNARLVAPHLTEAATGELDIMICSSWYLFGEAENNSEDPSLLEIVNLDNEEVVADKVVQAIQGGCSYPSDVSAPYEGPALVDLALQVSPPPKEGSLVAIARISMDLKARDYHQDELPPVCCGECDPEVNEYCPAPDELCSLGGTWQPPPEDEPAWTEEDEVLQ